MTAPLSRKTDHADMDIARRHEINRAASRKFLARLFWFHGHRPPDEAVAKAVFRIKKANPELFGGEVIL